MTGLGALQGLYLAILGFAKFVPPEARIEVFMAPLLLWMIALYNCMQVMMTRTFDINLNSPTDIRDHAIARVKNKQRFLTWAFAFLVAGLVAAMLLVILAWQYETLLSATAVSVAA
jgi:hypothetical protein